MNLYEQISDIFPHLVSIRKLEDYITIDVEFPTTWKLPKKYVDEKMVVEQKSDKPNTRFFSFATIFQKEPIDVLFYNLKNIIRYNKEREEKEKLFEDKVKELKSFFDKSNLDDLKALEFQIKQGLKIELEDEPEDGENIELVSEGN
jgi:hypothetical protein